MSQKDCSTLRTRYWRSRWLSGLAGVALLSSPALAEETDAADESTENVAAEDVAASEVSAVEIAAAPTPACSPWRLADVGAISPAAPPTASKASAILGGEMSSLDRIRMAQSGPPAPPATEVQVTPAVAVNLSNSEAMRDAIIPANARLDACAQTSIALAPVPTVTDDRLILGSLRLSIRKTPFDQKWGNVSKDGAARGLKRWLARTGAADQAGARMQVAAVNSWVNGRIAYADDSALYRQNDYWASSRETLRRGKGDCEDYAILKMDLLAAMGIDRDRMILVVARDLVRNADHAVLVVQLDDGPVVLDNATDRLLDGRQANDYRPIMSFASNGKWLHGYAVATAEPQPAPAPVVTIAALSVPSMPATALSAPVSTGN